MKAYKHLNLKGNLKNSEKKSKGIFCLPLYPEMKKEDVINVAENLKYFNFFKILNLIYLLMDFSFREI